MTVPSKTFEQFVSDSVAKWGDSLNITPVLSPGDFLLAIFEAVASQMDFLEAQIFMVLALTRATTSTGADLDTWMADFNFLRLPSTFATGPVTLIKLTPAPNSVLVPAATLVNGVWQGGTLVQTFGGAIVYQLIPDTAQTAYNALSNNYVLPANGTSITATAQAVVGGAASNVAAGAITQLGSQQAGIDQVTNPFPIGNGVDQESDTNFRARFILYLATLAKATKQAILAAAMSVQQGLQITLVENQLPDGTAQLGTFTAIVDNGTGSPPASLLASVFNAVDATRAFTVIPYVSSPTITSPTVVLAIRVAAGYVLGTLQPLVRSAIAAMTETLSAGATLYVSAIDQAALSVVGVAAVQPGGTTINGSVVDFTPAATTEVRVPTTSITVNAY